MAFYTGQSQLNLPRTPDTYAHHFTMNAATAALPSLRADFLNWSTWRASTSKQAHESLTSTPLTPPMTSTFQSRTAYTSSSAFTQPPPPPPSIPADEMDMDEEESEEDDEEDEYELAAPQPEDEGRMTLPPIAHLERHIHNLPPLTPPDDIPHHQVPSRVALPKIATTHTDEEFFQAKQLAIPMSPYGVEQSARPPSLSTTTSTNAFYHEPGHLAPPSSNYQHQPSSSTTDALEQPGITPNTSAAAATTITTLALAPAPPAYLVDWLDFTRTRSAHFVAEKTCEMICYLWFSIPSHAKASGTKTVDGSPTPSKSVDDPSLVLSKSTMNSVTTLQLVATPAFVSFMQKLLETTQVSQSVIVLSLHYIHRLKEKNQYMPAQPGSEFRIAVAGLMMANKFLDDNTYTNKTWSEVSGISLDEINRMEREFLLGVDFNLYVDKTTYASWLNLLKGLVLAKERDARRLLRGNSGQRGANSARRAVVTVTSSFRAGRDRDGKFCHPHYPQQRHQQTIQAGYDHQHAYIRPHQGAPAPASTGPATRTYTTPAAAANAFASASSTTHPRPYRHRARSTSPQTFTFSSNAASKSSRIVSHSTSYAPHQAEASLRHSSSAQGEGQSAYPQQFSAEAHSSSTSHFHTTSSPTPVSMQYTDPAPPTGSKRSAAAAFASPSSSSPAPPFHGSYPSKRATSVYASLHNLQIPEFNASASTTRPNTGTHSAGMNNHSPLEGLHGFERMNLGVVPGDNSDNERGREHSWRRGRMAERERDMEDNRQVKRVKAEPRPTTTISNEGNIVPHTLVAAYSADTAKKVAPPKNLFFYTLASSPNADEKRREREHQQREPSVGPSETSMESDDVPYAYSESKARKTRLRYQAAQPLKYGYDYADLNSLHARGAPLYSYTTTSQQAQMQDPHSSTSPAETAATPISPVPALVPARYSAASSYSHAALSSSPSSPSFRRSYAHNHASASGFSAHLQTARSHHTQPVVSVRVLPAGVQSASTSPAADSVAGSGLQHLPHFHDDVWAAPPLPAQLNDQDSAIAQDRPRWPRSNHQPQQDDHIMEYSQSPAPSPTRASNTPPYRHHSVSSSANPPPSLPGSCNSSPFHHQDVPSAPFANAGPPGVVTQFYSTPEVQQVRMPAHMPAMYSAYATYSAYGTPSGLGLGNSISEVVSGGRPVPHGFASGLPHGGPSRHHTTTGAAASGSGSVPAHTPVYTYSGAHSTSNSPYHSAAAGLSRYGDYAPYLGHSAANSSAYGR